MQYARRVPLAGAINVRDLGGYPTADGRVTPFGRFFRSDNMNGLGEEDIKTLLGRRIHTIVDLRTPGEVAEHPNSFAEVEGVTLAHCSLLGESTEAFTGTAESGFLRSLGENYAAMIARDGAYYRELFAILAQGVRRGGVLFHCTAGKDRTGVTAALLLALAGVYEVDIVADYALTEVYLKEKVERFIANNPGTPVEIFGARPESMEAFLKSLREEHGGAAAYLAKIGVPQAELDAIWGESLQRLPTSPMDTTNLHAFMFGQPDDE